MKKIFLTSNGLKNQAVSTKFLSVFDRPIKALKAVVIAHAKNELQESYLIQSKKELEFSGLLDIIEVNMFQAVSAEQLGEVDIIYVCGGNTFLILEQLRRTTLDRFIVKSVENGAVYVGVSAGGIIAGPSVKIASYGSNGDKNDVGLADLKGLDLVDFAIFPHFNDKLLAEVEAFRSTASYPVMELADGQAIFVNDGNIERI